jgi:hypothetical protein
MFVGCQENRQLTNWLPNCDMENKIKRAANISDDYTYRLFLQKNASKIMTDNTRYLLGMNKLCMCPKCTYRGRY